MSRKKPLGPSSQQKKGKSRKPPYRAVNLTRRQSEMLSDALDSIRFGDYEEAAELLVELEESTGSSPDVLEALILLYQATDDSENCCEVAERLMKLCPGNADARIMFAQASMYCGRTAIALRNYQEFITRWPDHDYVPKARQAIEILVPEVERRKQVAPFPAKDAARLCYLHEESLALLQQGKFAQCVAKCKELLAEAPTFMAARNNLAVSCFQCGQMKEAVAVVEETRRQAPDNRFAEAVLAKLYFLTGRGDDAQSVADGIVEDPPTEQDAIVNALETLTLLGRDEDAVKLAESAHGRGMSDESESLRMHYLAYAKCRLGDIASAKKIWKQCLKYGNHSEVRENLEDLEEGRGHAPWASSVRNWIPSATMAVVIESMRGNTKQVLSRFPGVAALIPALLDRGDPMGREAAVRLAMVDQSPPLMESLKTFAFGKRGPDALRLETLQFLLEKKLIGPGPHLIYNRGKQTSTKLLCAEISGEPRQSKSSPQVIKLMENGAFAMQKNDFDKAEAAFTQALALEPENRSAAYNLCTVWMQRDGEEGELRAIPRLEQLNREQPDYPFAAIALAQFAAMNGEFQRARDLLAPCFQLAQLHTSEAMALFTAQACLALEEKDIDAAEQAFDMLCQIADEKDPHVMNVRQRIEMARNRFRGLLPR